VVFVGGNDVRDALAALARDPTFATSLGILNAALTAIRDNLLTLRAAGASSFFVVNAPDVGLAPAVRLLGPAAQGAATFLAAQFNAGLEAILQGLESGSGLNIVRFDVFRALNEVVAAPGAFGLTNVTQPCIAVDTKAQPFCANPGTFLFWDGIHPTAAGHRILAERARSALP
jgi:phospholipase/lecithinase/hemolysin